MTNKFIVFLASLQLLLFPLSWLVAAVLPDVGLRPLLSSEGIRWFFAHFVDNMAQPLLVWLILFFVSVDAAMRSTLPQMLRALFRRERISQRQLSALRLSAGWFFICIVVIALLAFPRHAILLSITGRLIPSAFTQAFIPIVAFIVFSTSLCYALADGKSLFYHRPSTNRLYTWLLIYILAMQLYHSLKYIFFV